MSTRAAVWTVERAYSMVGGRKVLGIPKTHERRTLTFPLLAEAIAGSGCGQGPRDLLFCTRSGEPLDNSNFTKQVLTRACRAAGIDRLSFHDLRHTAASLAVQSGGNVKTVQNMLGHATATMTLDTYAGLFDTDAQALADRMEAARLEALALTIAHHLPTDGDAIASRTGMWAATHAA